MGIHQLPCLPPAAASHIAAKLLNKHSPHEIAEAIEVLIDVLDLLGGDPDTEANGDEQDGSGAEDDHGLGNHSVPRWTGPGCPISDPDQSMEDHPQGFDPEEDRCLAGDEGCGPIIIHGGTSWGADDDARRCPKPSYGPDQTKGPLDYRGGGYDA